MAEKKTLPTGRSMMFVPVNVDKFVQSARTRAAPTRSSSKRGRTARIVVAANFALEQHERNT